MYAKQVTVDLAPLFTKALNCYASLPVSLVQVGNLEDSNVYIRMKSKAATEVQIAVKHIKLPREVCQITLLCLTMFSQ